MEASDLSGELNKFRQARLVYVKNLAFLTLRTQTVDVHQLIEIKIQHLQKTSFTYF